MVEQTEAEMAKGLREIVPPNWLYVVLVPSLPWAVYHILTTRRATDILINSFRTGAAFFVVIALVGGAALYFDDPSRKVFRQNGLTIAIVLTLYSAIFGAFLYFLGASMRDLFFWLLKGIDALSGPITWRSARTVGIAVGLPLFFGVVLFCFRLKMRMMYGVTEALIGVIVFMFHLSAKVPGVKVTEPAFALLLLTASVYLVVRGLDNVHQGWKARDEDLAFRWAKQVATGLAGEKRRPNAPQVAR